MQNPTDTGALSELAQVRPTSHAPTKGSVTELNCGCLQGAEKQQGCQTRPMNQTAQSIRKSPMDRIITFVAAILLLLYLTSSTTWAVEDSSDTGAKSSSQKSCPKGTRYSS